MHNSYKVDIIVDMYPYRSYCKSNPWNNISLY